MSHGERASLSERHHQVLWPSREVWGGVLNSSFIIDDEIAISEMLLMVEDRAWTTRWIQSIVIMLTVIAKAMMDLSTDFTSKK